MTEFKKKPFEYRKDESAKIMEKYPGRLPIVVITNKTSFTLDKYKYLVPADLTVGEFIYTIRKRCKLTPEKSIFLFINNTLPATSELLMKVYKQKKDPDGFLYITISEESVFG
jgi:GABA(A) receptor-associated protein